MSGSVQNVVPATVLPQSLCRAFVHELAYPRIETEYKIGESHLSILTPNSRRRWRRTAPVYKTFWKPLSVSEVSCPAGVLHSSGTNWGRPGSSTTFWSSAGSSADCLWISGSGMLDTPVDLWFPAWEPEDVRIVTDKRIREFIARQLSAADAMWHWADVVESAAWRNPGDLKATFASASYVGELTVFNVGGNKYRIAAFVHYRRQIVYIKRIGTHEEYGKWDF